MTITNRSGLAAGLVALAVAFLPAAAARAQSQASEPDADSAVVAAERIGVIHSSPEEVWVDVAADLGRTWGLVLTTLRDFQYDVDPEQAYLESNGQIQVGGLWIVVTPQPDLEQTLTRVLIGTGDDGAGMADETAVIAGAILGVVADRVEGRAEPAPAAPPGAIPYDIAQDAYTASGQQVVNNYYYNYDSGPNYVPYSPYVSPWATTYSASYWGVAWWPSASWYAWGSPWCHWYKPYYSLCYTPWWGWKSSCSWASYWCGGGWAWSYSCGPSWNWNCSPWSCGSSWCGGWQDEDDCGSGNGAPPSGGGGKGGGGKGGVGSFLGVNPRVASLDVVPTSNLPRKSYDPVATATGSGGSSGLGGDGGYGGLPPIHVSGTDTQRTPRAGPRTIVVTTSRPSISTSRSPRVVAMPTVRFAPVASRVHTLLGEGSSADLGRSRASSFAPSSGDVSGSHGLFAPTRSAPSSSGHDRASQPDPMPTHSTSFAPAPVRVHSPTPTPTVSRPSTPRAPVVSPPSPARSTPPPTTHSSPSHSVRSSSSHGSSSRTSSSRGSSSSSHRSSGGRSSSSRGGRSPR